MLPQRFDHLSTSIAKRFSRRSALRTGAGLSGLALAGAIKMATAQEATPTVEGEKTEMLFVQTFESGSLQPKEGEEGTFILTLNGGSGRTIGFSDRPERIVGSVPMQVFLDGLGFSPADPPNAALVIEPSPGETDIIVLELLNPQYDEANQSLTYDVLVLDTFDSPGGLTFQEEPRQPNPEGEEFTAAELFIDDCPSLDGCYVTSITKVGPFPAPYENGLGQCWSWGGSGCQPDNSPCNGPSYQALVNLCGLTYPNMCGGGICFPD
jgi:hypothetical protein